MTEHSLHILPVGTDEGVESIRGDWDRLLSEAPNASVFQSYEWAVAWWNRFRSPDRRLFILVARNESTVVSITPWVLTTRKLWGVLPFRTIEFLGAETVNGDHLDLLVSPGADRSAVTSLVCGYLRRSRTAWDLIRMDSVPAGSGTVDALSSASTANGFETSCQPLFVCPAMRLPRSWNEVGAIAREGSYREVEYKTRRLTRQADWHVTVSRPDELPGALDILFDLHAKRWHLKGGSGAFVDSTKQDFYRDVCTAFARRGWLRFHVLHVNGSPAAALLCFCFEKTYTSMQNGFDPQWAKHSVGQVLLARVMEQAIAEGCTTFDFLRGEDPYKYDWGAVNRYTVRIEIRRRNLKNRMLRIATRVRSRAPQ